MLFEVGIPNMVCGYTVWSRSVACCVGVTVTLTLTSGHSSRITLSLGAFNLSHCNIFLVSIFNM